MKLIKICMVVFVGWLSARAASGQTAATATAPAPTNSPPWEASASAGLTLTRGNSQTLLFSAAVAADKKWTRDELSLGADIVYGEDHSVKTADAEHGFGQFNHLFSDRWYGFLRLDGLHDGIADIDFRLTFSGGPGYYFIKTTNTTLRAEAGPGYVYERQSDGTTHSYMTVRFAERWEQKLTDVAKLWESVEYLPQVDRFSNYIINGEVGVETAMSKKLSLMVLFQDSYHSEPAAGREQNDLKLIAGVKYKL